MKHHDKIDQLGAQLRELVERSATSIAEAAIYSAVNRDLAQADDAQLFYATASSERPGVIEIVFHDVNHELTGPDGWQSGPKGRERFEPVLTIDPMYIAKDIRAYAEEDGYHAEPDDCERFAALERNLRLSAMVLRDTLEQVDRVAAGKPPVPIAAEAIDAGTPGQLEFEVRVPVNVSIPPERRTSLTDDQLIAEAARRCPLEFDALRTAMAIQLSTLLERE